MTQSTIMILKAAIENTLSSLKESREQVGAIARNTFEEVARLEAEHEELKDSCLAAIERVEELEKKAKRARERLMMVNRDLHSHGERDMKTAYETAHGLQVELGQWRERETQLRIRRDDVARQLKRLQATAHRAEAVMLQFDHIATYLQVDFTNAASVLRLAQEQSLLGLQMLQIQEDEKRNVAQRLHDGPMQSLASVAMLMYVPPVEFQQGELAADVRQRLNGVIGDLRQLVFDLRPPLLDDLGLVPTLRRYTQQWGESAKLPVRLQLIGLEATLTPTEKVTLFRGVQEALQNVLQHAGATAVELTLLFGADSLRVSVADNGSGLAEVNWQTWLENGKLGLALCRQRVGILGGTVELVSRHPQGAEFVMELPMMRGAQRDTG